MTILCNTSVANKETKKQWIKTPKPDFAVSFGEDTSSAEPMWQIEITTTVCWKCGRVELFHYIWRCPHQHTNKQINKIKTQKPGSAVSSGGDTSRAEPPGEFEITTAVCWKCGRAELLHFIVGKRWSYFSNLGILTEVKKLPAAIIVISEKN